MSFVLGGNCFTAAYLDQPTNPKERTSASVPMAASARIS